MKASILDTYLADIARIHATRAGTGEVSYYGTLATALNEAGANDVFLNEAAFWRNVPDAMWSFTIWGYQVIKKSLSYRERPLLGRAMTPGEVRYVRDMARRLAALRLLGPELDANYRACAAAHRPLAPP